MFDIWSALHFREEDRIYNCRGAGMYTVEFLRSHTLVAGHRMVPKQSTTVVFFPDLGYL